MQLNKQLWRKREIVQEQAFHIYMPSHCEIWKMTQVVLDWHAHNKYWDHIYADNYERHVAIKQAMTGVF